MGYSAGNLELEIIGYNKKAISAIEKTIKALERLDSAVNAISQNQFVYAGVKLETLFTKIAKATNSINTDNISKLADVSKYLSAISRISNINNIDFDKASQGFLKLSESITPFINKIKESESSLSALEGILKKSNGLNPISKQKPKRYSESTYQVSKTGEEYLVLKKEVDRAEKSLKSITTQFDKHRKVIKKTSVEVDEYGNKITKIFGGKKSFSILGFGKIGLTVAAVKKIGRGFANLIQLGADYSETLNLWQVSMRSNLDAADQFISKMQKAYGISSTTLMNAQATYKNMIGSLGQISEESAMKISESLLSMTLDYASLYNRTIASAVENMQSMLAGQVRPIRTAGLDITETTLYQFYQEIGGTKTMRQLNRTEKQLLSILAVYKQMGSAGALGDMSKTLNSFANQSRIMAETWKELKTWTGLVFKDLIDESELLVHINGVLIYLTSAVKRLAKMLGVSEENYITGIFETTEATNEVVDELQGKLLDFDKFRSLSSPNENAFLGIDESLLKNLENYETIMDNVDSKAQSIADAIDKTLSSSGFGGDNYNDALDEGEAVATTLDSIYRIGVLGGGLITPFLALLIPKLREANVLLNTVASSAIGVGVALYGINVYEFIASWDKLESTKDKIVSIAHMIVSALLGVGVALALIKFTGFGLLGSIAAGATVSGLLATISQKGSEIFNFANGASDIDSGTIFRAGEFGKTEAVYTGSNGKTNVANVQQMKAAEVQALNEWWAKAKHDIPVFQGVSESGIYYIVDGEAKRRGKTFAKV